MLGATTVGRVFDGKHIVFRPNEGGNCVHLSRFRWLWVNSTQPRPSRAVSKVMAPRMARFELTAKCDGADGYHPAAPPESNGGSVESDMGFVVGFYGAAVLAFSLFVVVMTTPRTRVEEKTVVEALKRGEHDRAVKLMLDL